MGPKKAGVQGKPGLLNGLDFNVSISNQSSAAVPPRQKVWYGKGMI